MNLLTRILNAPALVQRSLALALAIVAMALAGWVLFAAAGSIASARADVEQKRQTLGQIEAVIHLAKNVESAATPVATPDSKEFLSGASEAVIRGALQTRLNAMAASNGVTVLSAGNAPTLSEDGVAYLGLRASVSGSLESVHGFLLRLETTLPVLFVREATLRTTNNSASASPARPPEIFAEVLFYGALQPAATAASGNKP
ncbi:type II secretion system protein GspM [Mesorhizobium sp. M1B.F.Ca.ET.045.04.1.1]|uniref:type II secretion system protein GspM n=1 Tax=Mesorhizobium sp. M1B.F.Ca.ET.045.04.1.1 TaxID=2493673 RepID=UPI001FE1BCF9|nr:type II secretion system protein GspM [Mesorhizobium sp. M1B.F.Ca.ET.045.04.1.1]